MNSPHLAACRKGEQKNSLSSLKKQKTEKAGTRFQKFKTQQCLSSFVFLVWQKFSPLFLLPSSGSTSISSSFFVCHHLPFFFFLMIKTISSLFSQFSSSNLLILLPSYIVIIYRSVCLFFPVFCVALSCNFVLQKLCSFLSRSLLKSIFWERYLILPSA